MCGAPGGGVAPRAAVTLLVTHLAGTAAAAQHEALVLGALAHLGPPTTLWVLVGALAHHLVDHLEKAAQARARVGARARARVRARVRVRVRIGVKVGVRGRVKSLVHSP